MIEPGWEWLLSEQLRHNGRTFFRLAHHIVRDAAAAEDVCQQAFLRAWEQRERIERGESSLKGWLARTVINGSLQLVRRGKIERRALAGHAYARPNAGDSSEELREILMAALVQLPEQSRLIVAMRVLEGMSGNQVKELLGCSASEVSRQLHRGLEQLRGLLAQPDLEAAG